MGTSNSNCSANLRDASYILPVAIVGIIPSFAISFIACLLAGDISPFLFNNVPSKSVANNFILTKITLFSH